MFRCSVFQLFYNTYDIKLDSSTLIAYHYCSKAGSGLKVHCIRITNTKFRAKTFYFLSFFRLTVIIPGAECHHHLSEQQLPGQIGSCFD